MITEDEEKIVYKNVKRKKPREDSCPYTAAKGSSEEDDAVHLIEYKENGLL